jgi:DNA polymerase-3 subunit gamma/tau
MSIALYRKWRSQDFEQVIGQEHVTTTLRNALHENRVAHAYLFTGPRGTGKTSTARILAKALNCSAPLEDRPCNRCPTCLAINEGRMIDLIEIDAASNNSVEDIRELREKVGFRPSEGQYKIYIVDEVHMLSGSAFNALLKTLEEPPPHARFILATTEPHKIPATVLSRCQRFDFRRIPAPQVAAHLRRIVDEEGCKAEDEALMAIARNAQGCMRDAVSLLDQLLSTGGLAVTFAQVQQTLGAVSALTVTEFVDAVCTRHAAQGLTIIQNLVTDGVSLVEFAQQVVNHLRLVMLMQMTGDIGMLNDLPGDVARAVQRQAKELGPAMTLFAVKRFNSAIPELKGGAQPQLPLEMALIEAVQGAPVAAPPVAAPAPAVQAAAPLPTALIAPGAPAALAPETAAPAPAVDGAGQAAPPPLDTAAVKRLQSPWKQFLATVRQQCGLQVQAALNSVRDIAVGGDSVAFAFGANAFSRDVIAKPDVLAKVSAILAAILGRTVALECQVGDHARLSVTTQVVGESSGPDPLVEFAISDLGAQVVEGDKPAKPGKQPA